jgi:acyl-CoA reductase-like NAD-dependent aldehyde dehydrogenase
MPPAGADGATVAAPRSAAFLDAWSALLRRRAEGIHALLMAEVEGRASAARQRLRPAQEAISSGFRAVELMRDACPVGLRKEG